ncbi:hypothetical protein GCM10023321_50390 [Pseudonocardia eucalypti]|uniref:Uncharacterized protein n=1 Tax=Pseudonocardia eucalypti TaxID=648755 RepID=A0ABP9QKL7_9PSEU
MLRRGRGVGQRRDVAPGVAPGRDQRLRGAQQGAEDLHPLVPGGARNPGDLPVLAQSLVQETGAGQQGDQVGADGQVTPVRGEIEVGPRCQPLQVTQQQAQLREQRPRLHRHPPVGAGQLDSRAQLGGPVSGQWSDGLDLLLGPVGVGQVGQLVYEQVAHDVGVSVGEPEQHHPDPCIRMHPAVGAGVHDQVVNVGVGSDVPVEPSVGIESWPVGGPEQPVRHPDPLGQLPQLGWRHLLDERAGRDGRGHRAGLALARQPGRATFRKVLADADRCPPGHRVDVVDADRAAGIEQGGEPVGVEGFDSSDAGGRGLEGVRSVGRFGAVAVAAGPVPEPDGALTAAGDEVRGRSERLGERGAERLRLVRVGGGEDRLDPAKVGQRARIGVVVNRRGQQRVPVPEHLAQLGDDLILAQPAIDGRVRVHHDPQETLQRVVRDELRHEPAQ